MVLEAVDDDRVCFRKFYVALKFALSTGGDLVATLAPSYNCLFFAFRRVIWLSWADRNRKLCNSLNSMPAFVSLRGCTN